MKPVFFLIAISSLLMAACNIKSSDQLNKETDDIVKKYQQDIDELTSFLYYGGQPGKITVSGIIVKKEDDKMILDNRIKIEQIGGKGNRGVSQTNVSEKNKAVLSDVGDAKATSNLSDSKNYISIGCSNLSAEEIDGLEQSSNEAFTDFVLVLSAKKIFICGIQQIPESTVNLSAEQIILKDASLQLKGSLGSLKIATEKIELIGTNTLETIGLDGTSSVLEAGSIDLTVNSEISGEGTLLITSSGGNCIK